MKLLVNKWDKYNKLTIIKEVDPNISSKNHKIRKFKCLCECWNITISTLSSIRYWHTKSCGCLMKKSTKNIWLNNKKHWYYKHKLYYILNSMINRCHNANNPNYKYYWAKGYKVCDEWLNDFWKWIEFLESIWFEWCDFDKDYMCNKLWLKEYSRKTVIAITHKENMKLPIN